MPVSKDVAHSRAKVAGLARAIKTGERKPGDSEYLAAKAALKVAILNSHIKTLVDTAPPLTSEQRTKLAELLKPVRHKPGAA